MGDDTNDQFILVAVIIGIIIAVMVVVTVIVACSRNDASAKAARTMPKFVYGATTIRQAPPPRLILVMSMDTEP